MWGGKAPTLLLWHHVDTMSAAQEGKLEEAFFGVLLVTCVEFSSNKLVMEKALT